jgi:hypothetical protein
MSRIFFPAKAVSSSPVSGEAGRGNRCVCIYSHFSFPQKRKKGFSSQRLLAPLLFQERPGEVIDVFAFIPISLSRKGAKHRIFFPAKTQKCKKDFLAKAVSSSPVSGEAGRGNRCVCIYSHFSFPQKRKKRFSSQRLLAPLLFQERQGEVIDVCIYSFFSFPQRKKDFL